MQLVQTSIDGRVGSIKLNRPDKRNALNDEMVDQLIKAFEEAAKNDQIKVIVLKGAGKAFSAGADLAFLQKLKDFSYEQNVADSSKLASLFHLIYTHSKVVIAQVEGHAIAGGCGLANVCDFTFSVPHAKFGYSEVKIGFIPAIVMIFLIRKIGEAKSKALLLTGKIIDAEEAMQTGLINKIIEADKISNFVKQFADALCEQASAESLKRTKQMIARVQEMSLDEALQFAAESNAQARATVDCQKGIQNFLNKQPLSW